jgi:hypothetical protein
MGAWVDICKWAFACWPFGLFACRFVPRFERLPDKNWHRLTWVRIQKPVVTYDTVTCNKKSSVSRFVCYIAKCF